MTENKKKLSELSSRLSIWQVIVATVLVLALGVVTILAANNRNSFFRGLGIFEIFAAIALCAVGIFCAKSYKKRLAKRLEEFAFCAETVTRTAIVNFPSPMMVATTEGEILWYNESFCQMIGRSEFFGEYIQDIFPDLQFSKFTEDEEPESEEYIYGENTYVVSGKIVPVHDNTSGTGFVSIYFTDITEKKQLIGKLADKKIVVCLGIIDNYDEVLKNTENANHGALLSNIEQCINQWVEKGEGISVRYERDKFLILFEAAKFQPLMQEKFTVLDRVREVSQGNRIPVTFSMGVSVFKDTLKENEKMARMALDMALGRGGDQAVVKNANGFQFFGAKSGEIEKSTRVKSRVVAHSLRDLADQASKVIIMGHSNADADSFGAAVGLFRMFSDRKVDTYIALDRAYNNVKMLLDIILADQTYNEKVIDENEALNIIDEKTLLVVVDTHRPSIVQFPGVLERVRDVVLIDHHRRSEDFIENTLLSYHEPYASSSSEMVTEILQYTDSDHELSQAEATVLYSGIYLDTKGFTFKTGARTFDAASYLRKHGADPVGVRKLFRDDLESYVLKSRIIGGAKIYRDNIAIALCEDKCSDMQLVVARAADELLDIHGIEAAFVLATDGNRIIISGRSLGSINVQVILEKLGGGGHITIAGAQVKSNSLEMAEEQLRAAIDEVLSDKE